MAARSLRVLEDDAVVRHGMLEPGLAYLEKPFRPQTLLKKVRSVLQTRSL